MDKNQLICDSIPFVYFIIDKHYPTYRNDEDIIQTGMLALVEAANKFDSAKGKFTTYAGVVIRNKIGKYIHKQLEEQTVSLDYLMDKQEHGDNLY